MFRRWFPISILFLLIAIAPLFATHDPIRAEAGHELEPPSRNHWLGTDRLGRDEWSRLVIGGRRTLVSTLLATGIATFGGLVLGSLRIVGSWGFRSISGILIDALLAFPPILLALIVRTALTGSLFTLGLAVGLANIAPYARIASDALLAAATAPHIEGARSIGANRWRILTRHIIPIALPTLIAFASVIFAWSLLYGAALAFLGLGGSTSAPDWGMMLQQAQGTLVQAPLFVFLPGCMIALSVWLAYQFADSILTQS